MHWPGECSSLPVRPCCLVVPSLVVSSLHPAPLGAGKQIRRCLQHARGLTSGSSLAQPENSLGQGKLPGFMGFYWGFLKMTFAAAEEYIYYWRLVLFRYNM